MSKAVDSYFLKEKVTQVHVFTSFRNHCFTNPFAIRLSLVVFLKHKIVNDEDYFDSRVNFGVNSPVISLGVESEKLMQDILVMPNSFVLLGFPY